MISSLPDNLVIDVPSFKENQTLVNGVVLDSRQVQPGDLFVALEGAKTDGHRFIPDAIQRGAPAVVGEKALGELPVPYIRTSDSRKALAYLSAAFYGFPARHLTIIGVTGTDGKTTTSSLIFNILLASGIKAGMISTVNAQIGEEVLDTGFHVTTPESPQVQGILYRMLASGISHVVLEVTSHGLAQQRVAACEFDLAVITNITHEHLDYHATFEAYRAAKGQLFTSLAETIHKPQGNLRLAVLNRDDDSFGYLENLIQSVNQSHTEQISTFSYGIASDASLKAEKIIQDPTGLKFEAVDLDKKISISSTLVGMYNVSNCLAAVAAAVKGLRIDSEAVRAGVKALKGIPGRMEPIDMGQEFLAIVDFAHTPNALRCSLETARHLASNGKVIAVFGSAGLRDRAKRRMMAEIAADFADFSILTAEDPRTESLSAILSEMAVGAEARHGIEGKTFWRIPDRRQAIRFAVSLARPGDLVIALGKGHEQSMCFGEIEYSWDDRLAMQAALAEHLGIPGPGMPFLPPAD
jgi:UDP-N-acetylmuramoyl-L-alanyl-D-glutamate--2,6-diaminopimelate ligase